MPAAAPFDRATVLANFGDDEALFGQMSAILLAQWPQSRAQLMAALAAGDWRVLRDEAHLIKGSFGNFAAGAAVAAARAVEAAAITGEPASCAERLEQLLQAGDALIAAVEADNGADVGA